MLARYTIYYKTESDSQNEIEMRKPSIENAQYIVRSSTKKVGRKIGRYTYVRGK